MSGAPSLAASLRALRAVVFDTDGVITDSVPVHTAAWQGAFDACLTAVGGQRPFDPVDEYLRYVDGRSRQDGAAAFLASRGVRLPLGEPDDAPGTETVWAVAARKDELFRAGLRAADVVAWPGTVRLLRVLRRERFACAAVSASRHAYEVLSAADVLGLLEVVVDGNEAQRLGLPGKPDPALFAEAARRLGVPPRESAVVEDAPAGVAAGRRGGFGLVVGVDRTGDPSHAAGLRRGGADLVVADPGELLTSGED
ncbi:MULTISPECIES: HAD family hydrolase [unclassified Streptomyces]|uniref:HAD family hydrolase n=1 Tax=unclassified Streptomyces TaxID=2593676 RepID=UPI0038267681